MSTQTILKINFLVLALVLVAMTMMKLRSGSLSEGLQALFGTSPVQTEHQTLPENKASR